MTDTKKLESYHGEAVGINEAMLSIVEIADEEEAAKVAAVVTIAHNMLKGAKEDLKSITDPLNLALKNVRTIAKKSLDPLEASKAHGKELLVAWETRQQDKLVEGQKALRTAAEEGAEGTALVELAKEAQPVKKQEGISYRNSYGYEVFDMDKVPREYLMIDVYKLSKFSRTTKGQGTLPGVELTIKKVAVSR